MAGSGPYGNQPTLPCEECGGRELRYISKQRCDTCQEKYELVGEPPNTPKDETDVYVAMRKQVKLLTGLQKRVESEANDSETRDLARQLEAMSKSLAMIGREILNFQRAKMDDIKQMSKEQWAEAIITWFAKQPRALQEKLIDNLHSVFWDSRKQIRRIEESRKKESDAGNLS